MQKDARREKKEESNTFYEAIPAAAAGSHELELPRISVRVAEFLEGIIFFSLGTAEILLLLRVILMMFGINGGNLMTYLLYASSYPFVMVVSSNQQQVPLINNQFLYENLAIMIIYFVIFYGALKIIRALKSQH